MAIINGVIAMLSVVIVGLLNTAFLVALVTGLIVGFVRERGTIGAALAFEPFVTSPGRGPREPAPAPA